jgi:predicted nucleic acid-binding protein
MATPKADLLRIFTSIQKPNKALHWTGIPLRSIPASELGSWCVTSKIMMKIILDGNIYNKLENDTRTRNKCRQLIEDGSMTVIITRTVYEELMPSNFKGIPDFFPVQYEGNTVARCEIMCAGDRLGKGVVFDAHLGQSHQVKDALIADAANVYADYLVTEDKRLGKRLADIATTCKVLTFEDFTSLVNGM